ncbi:acetamidase/formamidase family protein [Romeria aff. gracilis LEGE 07310]|uniref:Acetamidase/formamidase family protein n=1 Tax=Vasconcelosia minhoensis LEGE 07310 TaxID=915328 RepID=A0A8J7A6Q4_9CYAN|nr:acetamidase/formamidase family protein [Romeria gracilis]MBE9077792.1 acetamidase/formamidase family protein [Romeria aff. gracilis LEGE 07310]
MTDHHLKATCETVHFGGFSAQIPPALTVRSGDRVTVETFSGLPVYQQAPPAFLPPAFLEICENLAPERRVAAGPHLLTGPIYVTGAEPGEVLEIRLETVRPLLPVGFTLTSPGKGGLPDRFDQEKLEFIPIDLAAGRIEFPTGSGIKLPLKPFFGTLGVATAARDRNSIPPGDYGGNIDNRLLQPPCRLFLPVFLPGARFSIGDGHSLQGDGEVCLTALETSMEGTFELLRRADLGHLPLPLAETADAWITMGFAETLDAAFESALTRMVDFLEKVLSLNPEDAYMLCSLGVHFHITQAVNAPMKGVHGILPKEILPGSIQL